MTIKGNFPPSIAKITRVVRTLMVFAALNTFFYEAMSIKWKPIAVVQRHFFQITKYDIKPPAFMQAIYYRALCYMVSKLSSNHLTFLQLSRFWNSPMHDSTSTLNPHKKTTNKLSKFFKYRIMYTLIIIFLNEFR